MVGRRSYQMGEETSTKRRRASFALGGQFGYSRPNAAKFRRTENRRIATRRLHLLPLPRLRSSAPLFPRRRVVLFEDVRFRPGENHLHADRNDHSFFGLGGKNPGGGPFSVPPAGP